MRILVTGATGTVGRHVVDHLQHTDAAVRIASRDPDTARERLGDAGAFVDFDYARPETWGPALDGIDRLFLVLPPGGDESAVKRFVDTTARLGLAGRVTDDVEHLLGRPPRNIGEYVMDYRKEFAPRTAAQVTA